MEIILLCVITLLGGIIAYQSYLLTRLMEKISLLVKSESVYDYKTVTSKEPESLNEDAPEIELSEITTEQFFNAIKQ